MGEQKCIDTEPGASVWQEYIKKHTQLMRPYIPGEDLTGISVSTEDTPEEGGMIAKNRDNPNDQWYVAKEFFKKNYTKLRKVDA